MNKKVSLLCLLILGLSNPLLTHSAIYKHVDAEGRVTYSNVKIKGGKKIDIEPAATNFGTDGNNAERATKERVTPKSFPKVDAQTQKNRDNDRKQILLSELQAEKQALAQAKQAYSEGASNPEVYRRKNADGSSSTFRNVAKYQEKMKRLQADVDAHQRNIELLEQEISNLN